MTFAVFYGKSEILFI